MPIPDCIHRGPPVGDISVVCNSDRFAHGGQVYVAMCVQCPHANVPREDSRGLGDTVHKFTHAVGIDSLMPDCEGCKKRLNKLNELLPYKE